MKKLLLFISAIAIILLSFLIDNFIFLAFFSLKEPTLTAFFKFVSDYRLVIFILYIIPAVLLFRRKKARYVPFLALSVFVTSILVYLLKNAFLRGRPETVLNIISLVHEATYSFPSNHTAIAFACIPIIFLFKKERYYFLAFSILVGLSRMYLGAHYLSDVLAGATIGLLIGISSLKLENGKQDEKAHEFNRQFTHILNGVFIVLLIYEKIIETYVLIGILILGIIISLLAKKTKAKFIWWFLDRMDRKGKIPGIGALTFILGSIIVLYVFPREIALPAILILAFGDGMSTLVGKYYGRIKNPLNKKKTIEGTLAGIIFGGLAAMFFVTWWVAFIAAGVAMIIEAIGILDDNITIPLVAGLVLFLL
ncbi:MAG: phosphatase PAP2 family protein [Nanoarchaeota archaeon]